MITEQVIQYIVEEDGRFTKLKHNPLTIARFGTEDFLHLKKNLGNKGLGQVAIFLMGETDQGLELKIEVSLASYCEWEVFFEGFLDSLEDFKTVCRLLGI